MSGAGYKPKLKCSFLSFDFGPCHVWQQGMAPAVKQLTLTNEDRQAVSYDALFDDSDAWQVAASATVLAPGQSASIPVTFKPAAAAAYSTVLPLRVNGLYNINIKLAGACLVCMQQQQRAHCCVYCGSQSIRPCIGTCTTVLSVAVPAAHAAMLLQARACRCASSSPSRSSCVGSPLVRCPAAPAAAARSAWSTAAARRRSSASSPAARCWSAWASRCCRPAA